MTEEGTGKPVTADEQLARFILQRSHLRQDGTVKQDAFIPHPWPDLSVTRHLQLTESELWSFGQNVARQTAKTLHGRADVRARDFQRYRLWVIAARVEGNPNHAIVTGRPTEKPAQKIIAQQIAAAAGKAYQPPRVPA
ncbi:MAG: hypothetical protein ACREYF_09575 [Gammaproteobacteria bacterium]